MGVMRVAVIVAGAALALAGCKQAEAPVAKPAAPAAAIAPPAGHDWLSTVAQTPEGGFRMGNPDAPVKLVEYASFTCPHCKHFEDTAADQLQQKYISTGKVSWEFRSFLIHGPDAAVTLLMYCRGPEPFFALTQQLYAAQDDWLGKLIALTPAQQQKISTLPTNQQFKALADAAGLIDFLAVRGLPRAQAEACLTDQKAIDTMTKNQSAAENQQQVNSTPSFFINGTKAEDVYDWPSLDAKLKPLAG